MPVDQISFNFFFNYNEFCNEVRENSFQKDCYIHQFKDKKPLVFKKDSKSTLLGTDVVENNLFNNSIAYFELLKFFKVESESQDIDFEFTDYYSSTTRKIVLASLNEKRKITFKYPQVGIPYLPMEYDCKRQFDQFEALYNENKYYPVFLKNAIISKLGHSQDRLFYDLFENLHSICKEAKLNFGVYIHQLSLDSIKTDYKDFKDKYYSSQSDILNKVSSQIIALPISIAGSAFAIYKLKDSNFGMVAICIGLIIFLIYMSYITHIYWKDLAAVNIEMNRDYTELTSQSFFKDHGSELDYFKKINHQLKKRVTYLKNSIRFFCVAIWLMTLVLTLYAFNLVFDMSVVLNLMYVISFTAIYSGVDFYVIFKNENSD